MSSKQHNCSDEFYLGMGKRQNFMETCRVRFTHRDKSTANGFLFQMTLLWYAFAQTSYRAKRTLRHLLHMLMQTGLIANCTVWLDIQMGLTANLPVWWAGAHPTKVAQKRLWFNSLPLGVMP
jgi:hypothetical protein